MNLTSGEKDVVLFALYSRMHDLKSEINSLQGKDWAKDYIEKDEAELKKVRSVWEKLMDQWT